jgi:SAM-dependent methyltransferase
VTSEPYKSLLKYVPKVGSALVLDAGCGNFTYTNFLKEYVHNLEPVCIDLSNLDPMRIRKNSFLLASIGNLPFRDNSFDFVFCLSVIEFVENDLGVINEFHRILKKGGMLILTAPTKFSLFKVIRDLEILCGVYKYPQFNVKHYHYYSRLDIPRLVREKFDLVDLRGYRYNFIPRLMTFSLSLLMSFLRYEQKSAENLASTNNEKKLSYVQSIGNSYNDLSDGKSMLKDTRVLIDLSYHYVIVLFKQTTSNH